MKVLVINCGSSSLKYQLIDMDNENVLGQGVCERIGINNSFLKHKDKEGNKNKIEQDLENHSKAIELVIDSLIKFKAIESLEEIGAVGHRTVHGGEAYSESVLITEDVKNTIKELFDLAPLHNPANLTGIEACEELMPNVPQVAVFDTAFHQTMPASSYIYSIPYELYEKYKIRKYGFHGSSHRFVSKRAAEMLGKKSEELNIITCHIGNGASLCAIKGGKSFDTTMGFTPLEGLTMGTRSGDVDPSVIQYLMKKEDLSIDEVMNILNKKSGVLGISKLSSDMRDIEDAAWNKNDANANLALDKFHQVIKRYIGGYMAEMDGVDAIVFTAGVGEMAIETREFICSEMEHIGIKLDKEKNQVRAKETIISADDSKVKILLIPTNEELVIAQDTKEIVSKL